jgi:hypothetical protein
MPDEHKTLEQRFADIELNLKKLREEIIGAYISWEGKVLNRVQRQNLSNQSKHRPHRRKSRNLSDWASDEIPKICGRSSMRSITNAIFSCKVAGGRSREARLENPRLLAEAEAVSDSVRAFNASAGS